MTAGRDPRRQTEEAARSGRFPDDDGALDDDSNPIEPEADSEERRNRGGFDRGVDTEHLRSPSQGARPDPIEQRNIDRS